MHQEEGVAPCGRGAFSFVGFCKLVMPGLLALDLDYFLSSQKVAKDLLRGQAQTQLSVRCAPVDLPFALSPKNPVFLRGW